MTATIPIARSPKGHFWAVAMEGWYEELRPYGFTPDCFVDNDDGTRTVMLLGPDSPAEMVYTFARWRLADPYLQPLANELVRWADRATTHWLGHPIPGFVPDACREQE